MSDWSEPRGTPKDNHYNCRKHDENAKKNGNNNQQQTMPSPSHTKRVRQNKMQKTRKDLHLIRVYCFHSDKRGFCPLRFLREGELLLGLWSNFIIKFTWMHGSSHGEQWHMLRFEQILIASLLSSQICLRRCTPNPHASEFSWCLRLRRVFLCGVSLRVYSLRHLSSV